MACCLLVIGCGKKADRFMVADDNALAVMDSESKIDTIKKDYHIKGSLYHTYYGDVDLDTCKSDEDVDGNKIYLVKVYPKLRSWVQGRMVDWGPYEVYFCPKDFTYMDFAPDAVEPSVMTGAPYDPYVSTLDDE